ncbi:hypothetical protein [Providencia rettgeri]|uniref:hypothetical protein n=1 Tax=Providencia rettgeri TaxID=587 RepID=UPI003850A761
MNKFVFALTLLVSTTQVALAQTNAEIHENAATALSFTENNTAYSNLKAINRHLNQAGISTNKNTRSTEPFSQLDSHEQAAIALSFTHNNTSASILNMIEKHQEKSKNRPKVKPQ